MINTSCFRAYDIRGKYPSEINEELAYRVGRAYVERFQLKNVVVGRDMRGSGLGLFEALARGIIDAGADVIDIGVVTTPIVSFTLATEKYNAGISISGSHNPGDDNAFKLVRFPMFQVSDEDGLFDIREMCEKGTFEEPATKGTIIKKEDAVAKYQDHIREFMKDIHGLKVVVDYGNGVGSIPAKKLFEEMDIEYTGLFEEPDMSFPNHEANPHDLKNFEDIQAKIKELNANVGVFFDGDADRSILVDEQGNVIDPDVMTALVSADALKRHPGEKVYYDLRFSRAVRDYIQSLNGIPVMMRVGNPFYKKRLHEEGGAIAAEFSGHIMFPENYCLDDGMFAAVQALTVLSRSGKKLSELVAPFKTYFNISEMNFVVADADTTMKKVADAFMDGHSIDLDGVYVEYKDWWFNLRKSNTEPKVRLRVEATTKEVLDEKLKQIVDIINTLK